MDLVNRASIIAEEEEEEEEEDRISKLPDDIIHHILSFLDMKHAVQTCKLSRKWKNIWTSMPCLNLDIHTFGAMSRFGKFVKRVLSHRNNHAQVSTVKFVFTGNPHHSVVNDFVKYVYSHNVKQMTLIWLSKEIHPFPQLVFSSHTLKHLTIRFDRAYGLYNHIPNSAWDFPALETLNLTRLKLGQYQAKSVNLFSKCVILKNLTLHRCSMPGVDIFNVCAPQLSNLTITGCELFPKVFNVVAPQLKNFTASIVSHFDSLRLSTEGFDSLEKVNFSACSIPIKKTSIQPLLDLFPKLHTAKFLILDAGIIEVLSICLHQFFHIPCPFNNLRCLKFDLGPLSSSINESNRIAKIAPQVKNYFLENSPNATFIMDLPKVPHTGLKRPMQEVNNNTMANKEAKLEVPTVEPSSVSKPSSSVPPMRLKRPMQTMHNGTMSNKMPKLDVPPAPVPSSSNISKHEVHIDGTTKNMANMEAVEKQPEKIPEDKIMLEVKIQMQDQLIAEQKAMFEAKIQMQDEILAKQKATFEAKIQMQDEVLAKQKATFGAKIQMQDEVIAKQKAMYESKTQMVEAAKLQHEKLMSLIIKSKIAELKAKVERGNPGHEVVHTTGVDIGSVMDLIPESLRVKLEARFSVMYEGFKSLFLTHFSDSHWEKIESQLDKEYKTLLE